MKVEEWIVNGAFPSSGFIDKSQAIKEIFWLGVFDITTIQTENSPQAFQ